MVNPLDLPPEQPVTELEAYRIAKLLDDPEFIASVLAVVYDSARALRERSVEKTDIGFSADDTDEVGAILRLGISDDVADTSKSADQSVHFLNAVRHSEE